MDGVWADEITITVSNRSVYPMGFELRPLKLRGQKEGYRSADVIGAEVSPKSGVTFNILKGRYQMDVASTGAGTPASVPYRWVIRDAPANRIWTFEGATNKWGRINWDLAPHRNRPFIPYDTNTIPESLQFFKPIEKLPLCVDPIRHALEKLGPDVAPFNPEGESSTHQDYLETWRSHRRRIWSEAVEIARKGRDWNERIPALVEAFLSGFEVGRVMDAGNSANFGADDFPDADPFLMQEICTEATLAIEEGCDNPLVHYILGTALLEADDLDPGPRDLQFFVDCGPDNWPYHQVNRHLQAAVKGFDKGYPGVLWLDSVQATIHGDLRFRDEMEDMYTNALAEAAVRAVSDNSFAEGEERVAMARLSSAIYQLHPYEKRQRVIDAAVENPEGLPWLRHMLKGWALYRHGWDERGSGYANTVSSNQWVLFEHVLTNAVVELESAWDLEPTYPEPCEILIRIGYADKLPPGQTMWTWFQNSINAQVDYQPSVEAMLWGLTPRWGGRHGSMIVFGMRCAGTDRYDTWLPFTLVDAMNATYEDDSMKTWTSQDEVRQCVDAMLARMAAHPAHSRHRANLLTMQAGYRQQAGDREGAIEILEVVGDGANEKLVSKAGLWEPFADLKRERERARKGDRWRTLQVEPHRAKMGSPADLPGSLSFTAIGSSPVARVEEWRVEGLPPEMYELRGTDRGAELVFKDGAGRHLYRQAAFRKGVKLTVSEPGHKEASFGIGYDGGWAEHRREYGLPPDSLAE